MKLNRGFPIWKKEYYLDSTSPLWVGSEVIGMKSMADYSRQLSLQWMNESRQASIIQSRVLIFGAGGLGVDRQSAI
jgi:hypothetical protein